MDYIWKIAIVVACLKLFIVFYYLKKRTLAARQPMTAVQTGTIIIGHDTVNANTNGNVNDGAIEISFINLPSDGGELQPPDYFLSLPPYEMFRHKENEPPPSYETATAQTTDL